MIQNGTKKRSVEMWQTPEIPESFPIQVVEFLFPAHCGSSVKPHLRGGLDREAWIETRRIVTKVPGASSQHA
jgi:hypothetical protein